MESLAILAARREVPASEVGRAKRMPIIHARESVEERVARLEHELDRVGRVVAWLEHEVALRRIDQARSRIGARIVAWLEVLVARFLPSPTPSGPAPMVGRARTGSHASHDTPGSP